MLRETPVYYIHEYFYSEIRQH